MKTLYVTRPTDFSDARSRYLHDFRPSGRIVEAPEIGDQVVDLLSISPTQDAGYQVWSHRRCEAIALSSAWDWGDQYEPGAEYELAQHCLDVLFGAETCLDLVSGPLFPLVYPID